MAYNFDPGAGMFGTPPGAGVLAQPATITNPLAPPMTAPAPDAATLQAMAEARAKNMLLEKALFRKQALMEQPGGGFAQGAGPLGIRQGVGPGGWMTSLADAVAGLITRGKQDKNNEEVTAAMGALSPAEQAYVEQYLKGDAASLPRTGRAPMSYVPQGSPLSIDPLGLK